MEGRLPYAVNPVKSVGCGIVNARNSMGGYAGARHFILFPDGDLRFEPESSSAGSTTDQLEAAQRSLNYLYLVKGYCEAGDPAASAPPR